MHAKDLVVDHDAESKKVEHVGKVMPHVGISVFPRTFRIEPIRLCDASRLVIASDQMDAGRVS